MSLSAGFIYDVEKDKSGLTNKSLLILQKEFNLNLNWLITGEGEMFLPNSKNKSSMGENEVEILSLYRNNKQFRELMDNMIDVYKGGYDIIKAFNQMLKTLLPSDKK